MTKLAMIGGAKLAKFDAAARDAAARYIEYYGQSESYCLLWLADASEEAANECGLEPDRFALRFRDVFEHAYGCDDRTTEE